MEKHIAKQFSCAVLSHNTSHWKNQPHVQGKKYKAMSQNSNLKTKNKNMASKKRVQNTLPSQCPGAHLHVLGWVLSSWGALTHPG